MTRAATEGMTSPKQQRSQETLERILDATEALLAEGGFEDITVADIVARARSSVGSFYARFSGKEALIPTLMVRYHEDITGRLAAAIAETRREDADLRTRARLFIAMVVGTCRSRAGLLRLRLQLRLAGAPILAEEAERDQRVVRLILEMFEPAMAEVRRDDAHGAIAFVTRIIDSLATSLFLDDIYAPLGSLDEEEAVDRLTRVVVGYLTVRDEPATSR